MEERELEKLQEELKTETGKARNSLSTDRLDMSFGEIISMYEREEVIIAPEFQRLFRWTNYQQTRFIESLLLGIPIPPIFVAEDKEGRWELVDGLQRISTLLSFFGYLFEPKDQDKENSKNNWKLCEGDLIKSLEGFRCKDLPLKLQLNIRRSACRIEIIRWNSEYDMRYELFNRLNTGGSPLEDQEIRNAIFRGKSNDLNNLLKELSKNSTFLELIKPTDRQIERLFLEELVLRFLSLVHESKDVKNYLSQHMTNYMQRVVGKPDEFASLGELFLQVLEIVKPIGMEVFRGKNKNFSPSLYDGVMVGIAKNLELYQNAPIEKIVEKIDVLKNSKDFKKASGSYSNSKTRVIKRLAIADEIFSKLN